MNWKPSDLFGVIIRTIGFWISLRGVWIFWWGFAAATGIYDRDPLSDRENFNTNAIEGMAWIAFGAVLLRFAPWIVSFCYAKLSSSDALEGDN
jgi:hypothetical protein